MSTASFKKNKENYLDLCKSFLDGTINSEEFGNKFYKLYKEDEVVEISKNEIEDEDSLSRKLLDVVSSIYVGIDSCSDHDEPDRDKGECTPDELRKYITDLLAGMENRNCSN